MKLHEFKTSMKLPLGIDEVFSFFCDTANLEKITPPQFNLHLLTPRPIEITQGMIMDYKLKLYGFPLRWQLKIADWNPPHQFIDEQIRGPFRVWIHTHRFREEKGGTIIEDHIRYALRFWPMGEIASPLVRAQVKWLFKYRQQGIQDSLLGKFPKT